jgi:hypothetical protein
MPYASPLTRHFALRLSEETWLALVEKATQEKRSINAQILLAIEQDLAASPAWGTRSRPRPAAPVGDRP